MYTEYQIPEGIVVKYTKDSRPNGLFSLNKLFKKLALRYNVPFVDTCCTIDPTNLPVRFNKTAGHVQYFDNITLVWTNAPNL